MSKSKSKRALFGAQVMPNPTRLQRPTLELDKIRTDGGTQPREQLDEETLQDYATRMILDENTGFVVDPEQQKWPELVVFFDGTDNWLADGFHRFSAAKQAELNSFQVRREEGSLRDAILYSLGVNATHGKRRTNVDKRRAIARALQDEEWRLWSDSRIASLCKVSSPMVSKLRVELEEKEDIPFEPILYSSDGREFERPQPAPRKVSATTAKDTTKTTSTPNENTASKKSFSALAKQDANSLRCLVAYPTTAAHWDALATHAAQALDSTHGTLIVHLPSSATSGHHWAGMAKLNDEKSFKSSHVCYIKSHSRHYAIWSVDKSLTPGAMLPASKNLMKLIGSKQVSMILGTALDSW